MSSTRPLIAILTDFGHQDGFVGAMKGVMKRICPDAEFIDLTHGINDYNIMQGAMILRAHHGFFPKGTIFLSVVDPGVGSDRKGILLKTEDYIFVGPDNGLFDLIVRSDNSVEYTCYELSNSEYQLPRTQETFHGRDVFGPAAAHLANGIMPSAFGQELNYRFRLGMPPSRVEKSGLCLGEVILFDKYGNAVTNIPVMHDEQDAVYRGESIEFLDYFDQGLAEGLYISRGALGFYELISPRASAKELYGIRVGDRVRVYCAL